jgi:hypothetical protein
MKEEMDKSMKPKDVAQLEMEEGSDKAMKSPSQLIKEFLRKNPSKAYKVSQLQKLLNLNDYWAVKYACKSLVLEGILKSFKANPTWYAWRGA